MDYVELNIPISEAEMREIITAELADFPFESFKEEGEQLKAYIPQERLADCMEQVDALLKRYSIEGARYISIETQNWNAQWESNFEQVEVGTEILIRAPFHAPNPAFRTEVVIMPKMSFGTGHHATTHLMSEMITKIDVKGKRGLDMGSGTGVLAIIAVKYGATAVDAIDIDEWAFENCKENIVQNGVDQCITPMWGGVSLLEGGHYDFILANINRNILLADMESYVATLAAGGTMLMSGFFVEDIAPLRQKAEELGLTFVGHSQRDGWAVIHLSR
ncbi:MAG: 50S ribosomal protein L11 methyltransferase [Rikenellaceae bacterium]